MKNPNYNVRIYVSKKFTLAPTSKSSFMNKAPSLWLAEAESMASPLRDHSIVENLLQPVTGSPPVHLYYMSNDVA